MKASDLEEVTDLLKDLGIFEGLVARDHSWGVDLYVAGVGIPPPSHPMYALWETTKTEVRGVIKGRMLSRTQKIRAQLVDLGVEVNWKEEG